MSAVETGAVSGKPGDTPPVAGQTPASPDSPDEPPPARSNDASSAVRAGEPIRASPFSKLVPYLLIFQVLSGVVLMFTYHPSAGTATLDLVDLREASRLGFVRGLHFWGSHAVVIIVWLAVLQVGLRGVQRQRRELKLALVVMLLTLALAATGHVLPGDDTAYGWLTQLLEPTLSTDNPPPTEASDPIDLIGFYVMHCIVLPLAVAAVLIGTWRRASRHRSPLGLSEQND